LIRRLLPAVILLPVLASCAKEDDFDVSGGLNVVRSTCPAVAIPAYTGDVSLFSPEQSQDARALDVSATITNLRTSCDQSGDIVHTKVTFDVVARRASPNGERDLILPYFATVMRAGTRIVSKQVARYASTLPTARSARPVLPVRAPTSKSRSPPCRRWRSNACTASARPPMSMRRSIRWLIPRSRPRSMRPISSF